MDQIADMLTRIRNAQMVKKESVVLPFSKFKFALANLLKQRGYLSEVSTSLEGNKKYLHLGLKYVDGVAAIKSLRRISHQGQRIYVKKDNIPVVKNGFGMVVLSTSQGLLTDDVARKKGLGGEIICEVW